MIEQLHQPAKKSLCSRIQLPVVLDLVEDSTRLRYIFPLIALSVYVFFVVTIGQAIQAVN